MKVASPLPLILQQYASAAQQLPSVGPVREIRATAVEQLQQLGWPTWRDEAWRHSGIRQLDGIKDFQPRLAASPTPPSPLPSGTAGFMRLLCVDGRFLRPLPGGVEEQEQAMHAVAWPEDLRLGYLTDLFVVDPLAVRLADGAQLELLFVHGGAQEHSCTYPRLQIEIVPGARVQLLERRLDQSGATALACSATHIQIGSGASLRHFRLQQSSRSECVIDTLSVHIADRGRYEAFQISTGASLARTSVHVDLHGRDASAAWSAVSSVRAAQIHDTALRMSHRGTGTRSEQVFRAIADDDGRSAFSGMARILEEATGSDAQQSMRGLLQSPQAEIDLRPRLEISTDQVSAKHGATTGQIDESLLFYLLSRGLDADEARALLQWAFLGDVMRGIHEPQVRTLAESMVAQSLRTGPSGLNA